MMISPNQAFAGSGAFASQFHTAHVRRAVPEVRRSADLRRTQYNHPKKGNDTTTRLIVTLLTLVTCRALAGDTGLPVSVTIGGRTNDAAGVNKMTFALTNLTSTSQYYRFIALEPQGAGGAWHNAQTQSDGAASSHFLAAGATTNLTVRPPRGAGEWRLQFWFSPVDRSAKEVTMRTDKIVER